MDASESRDARRRSGPSLVLGGIEEGGRVLNGGGWEEHTHGRCH